MKRKKLIQELETITSEIIFIYDVIELDCEKQEIIKKLQDLKVLADMLIQEV